MNILIVEDELEMASALVRGLQEEFVDVQLAQDGRGGLRLSEDCSFDLILLDVMLPDQSGFEIVRQLRQRNQDTPVPAAACCGNGAGSAEYPAVRRTGSDRSKESGGAVSKPGVSGPLP
ncbi:MAG: response regulator, partial [Candidatus Acidiferrales bacterium]